MSYTILVGDCRDTLRSLPDQSVHCCVTSPPYYGLRDYGVEGQLGLEPTPDEYVAQMVSVFREVRRVLRDDGTLWLNLGDSYATQGIAGPQRDASGGLGGGRDLGTRGRQQSRISSTGILRSVPVGLKPKDLVGIPWRVAFALQADGWYLRQDIIWHKPNPMPESVKDRCTKAHEYIFLLSKNERYYYDAEAIKEPETTRPQNWTLRQFGQAGVRVQSGSKPMQKAQVGQSGRNRRSVWTVSTKPYPGSHFAVFPPALIEPCILAGCPEGGTVLDPFGGSGTTAMVALKHGRNAILCELNPKYIELMHERCGNATPAANLPLFEGAEAVA